ncbi:uncharacterized protein BJX67DRAFT_242535 [Aspergillus lucknowensis]|uniref:DUF7730 domain-containing protein n=1 Tax=Aspergillus lucknowensis TaxID=176173 RepID=A0ABR4M1D7_9EURO
MPRQKRTANSTPEELFAVSKRTRRGAKHVEDERGLYKVLQKEGLAFRLLDLPLELRRMIYRFAFGYRVLHITFHREEHPEYYRVYRNYWRYAVCKCDVATHPTLSEFAVGEIWAGDADVEDTQGCTRWRHTIPACHFEESNHRWLKGARPHDWTKIAQIPREKVHLSLLRANRQVYAEARDIPYTLNIYAFEDARALKRLVSVETGLSKTQLGLIRNMVIRVEPKSERMHDWNRWLAGSRDGQPERLDALTGLQRLQVVVSLPRATHDVRREPGHWTDLWLVYGLLVLAKLGVREVSVDTSLCRVRRRTWPTSEDEEAFRARDEVVRREAEGYARMLEGRIRGPWDEGVERQMRAMEAQYLEAFKGAFWMNGDL